MQLFKSALRIFFSHPVYILVYVFFLTFMGVFIGMSNYDVPEEEFTKERPHYAVIDRDKSTLSQGLIDYLNEHADLREVEDSRHALQDAIAQNYVSYVVIIPENFGSDFETSARDSQKTPSLETTVSYASISANMMDGLIDEYLQSIEYYLSTGTATSQSEAIKLTRSDMDQNATVSLVSFSDSSPVSQQWSLYMRFSGYTIMLSIIVCTGVVLGAFNRTEIRRRYLASPISSLSTNLQLTAACVLITLMVWAWASICGLLVFGQSLTGVNPEIIGLILLVFLCFCTVPLAIGFLLAQISSSELVVNAAGNITGLVFSFLGGLWIPLDFMGDAVVSVAHFAPTYYYADAVSRITNLYSFSSESLEPIFTDMGIMLLFTVAIFAVALAIGRLRVQSSDAGGNAAAAQNAN